MQQLPKNTLLQGGKYKIEKVLGQGGFGITYLATQELLERKICIKEFFFKDSCGRTSTGKVALGTVGNMDLVDRFLNKFIKEARTISKLEHPNIIRIFDIFMENGTAYYVMDYIEGESLEDIVKRRGALPEHEAVSYIKQVANALDYLHQHKINHLDVKPANIMVRKEDNKAILIDFGVSKQYDDQGEQTSTTPVGISHGYAPIEQYQPSGVSEFSPLTDVYSLGATLYRLVTGNVPPHASNVLNGEEPSLKDSPLSTGVKGVVILSMQPQKRCRPQSIRNFIAVIDADYEEETKRINSTKEAPINNNSKEKSQVSSKVFKLFRGVLLAIVLCLFIDQVFTIGIEKLNQITKEKTLKEQQRIDDSISIVRRQEVERRRKDSVEALNEQVRLATVRKLDEERKRKEELNSENMVPVNEYEQDVANIISYYLNNTIIDNNGTTTDWSVFDRFKKLKREKIGLDFNKGSKKEPYCVRYNAPLKMNGKTISELSSYYDDGWQIVLYGPKTRVTKMLISCRCEEAVSDYIVDRLNLSLYKIIHDIPSYKVMIYSKDGKYISFVYNGGSSGGDWEISISSLQTIETLII